MLKNILKLEGAQRLSKNEQSKISGGNWPTTAEDCDIQGGTWVCYGANNCGCVMTRNPGQNT